MTWFAKTVVTPAGTDVCSRTKAGLSEAVTVGIKEAWAGIENLGGWMGQVRSLRSRGIEGHRAYKYMLEKDLP